MKQEVNKYKNRYLYLVLFYRQYSFSTNPHFQFTDLSSHFLGSMMKKYTFLVGLLLAMPIHPKRGLMPLIELRYQVDAM